MERLSKMSRIFCIGIVLSVSCFLDESNGQSSSATPRPGRPPRILEHPSDLIVPKNEPATLQCKADGEPSPEIFWYKDSGELISSSSASAQANPLAAANIQQNIETEPGRLIQQNGALHFSRVLYNNKKGKPDAGVYFCIAKNTLGEAKSRNASLQVALLRDEFRRQPNLKIQVAAGDTALLECQPPRGFPEPRVYWKRDGAELKTTGRFTMMDEGNLVITEVRASDAGKYVCVAENLVGVKESHAAALTVRVKPSFISPPQDINAIADDNVVFECKVTGDPEPTVIWRKKDDRWSLKDSRVSIHEDRSLRIERVSPSDEGVYVCEVENSVGSISASAVLSVHSRPSFLVTPRDQRVAINGAASFECLTAGNPRPSVYWYKEGSQALLFPGPPVGRFTVQSDGTLLIDSVKKEDTGHYVCQALSAAGDSIAKAYLEVSAAAEVPPPVIKLGPANQTLALNSIAMLPCQATDIPPSTIHWVKDGVLLLTSSNPRTTLLDSGTLQISDLQLSDSGIYTCLASSESGETTWSASLVVESPTNPAVIFHRMPDLINFPDPPSKPQVVNVTETSVEIQWRIPISEGASPVVSYRIEFFSFDIPMGWMIATESITSTRYNLTNLRADTSYLFLVRALNSHGISLPSIMSEPIRTLGNFRPLPEYDLADIKAKFSQQLVELSEVKAISSTAVNLYWNILRHGKYIGGYYIRFRRIEDGHLQENYSLVSVRRGQAETHTLLNLRKNTKYEFILVPFYKEIKGTASNPQICKTLEDVPDESPQDISVNLVNLTSISITWLPPSADKINGVLMDYRILIAPANMPPTANGSSGAFSSTMFARNIVIAKKDSRSEVIGNLTAGMRYRVTMAARTDAGIGVMSKPVYIRMERTIAGTADFLKNPWFIGALGALLFILILAFCVTLYLRHTKGDLRRKSYPPLHIQQMGIPFHPGMQTVDTILPDSSVVIGRRPVGTYARNGQWAHADGHTCDWANQQSDQKENLLSSFDIPLGSYGERSHHGDASPYATTNVAMQKQNLLPRNNSAQNPPMYNDIENDKPKYQYENGVCHVMDLNSSLSSRSHQSHPETLSVHSQRSSPKSNRSSGRHPPLQKATFLPTLNWADILPPPPKHPPPSEMSLANSSNINCNQDDYSSVYYDDDGNCVKCGSESEREQDELFAKIEKEKRPEPPPRNPRHVNNHPRQRISSDRSRYQQPAHPNSLQVLSNLARNRSLESCVTGDGEVAPESMADMASDPEYGDGDADAENEDLDTRSRESSPCLSSEASFFLEPSSTPAASKAALAARHRDQPDKTKERTSLLQQYPRNSSQQARCVRHGSLRFDNSSTANQSRQSDRKPPADRACKTFAKRPNKFDFSS